MIDSCIENEIMKYKILTGLVDPLFGKKRKFE